MLAFRVHGWELVVSDVQDGTLRALQARAQRVVRVGDGRYTLELPLQPPPERLIAEVAAAGAKVVSLNPIRQTLEDFFVQQVTRQPEVVDLDIDKAAAGERS
jgi:hypothetical protein